MASQPNLTPTLTDQVRSCYQRLSERDFPSSDDRLYLMLRGTLAHMQRLAEEIDGHASRVSSGQSSPEDLVIQFKRGVLDSTRSIRQCLLEIAAAVTEDHFGSAQTKATLGDMLRCLAAVWERQTGEWEELKKALHESRQSKLEGEASKS